MSAMHPRAAAPRMNRPSGLRRAVPVARRVEGGCAQHPVCYGCPGDARLWMGAPASTQRRAPGSQGGRPGGRGTILTAAHKDPGGADGDSSSPDTLSLAKSVVASPLYSVVLEGAVFVFLLGLVDAAYSGDWSRIGAISVETEDQLKQCCVYVAIFHCFCAPVAAVVAQRRGLDWIPLTLKVAAVGGLALLEVLLTDGGEEEG
mmetsp:Transcript_44410/g.113456  ORF Transcript_44410/g.113456 Transcript_44410/m.113456 type:complete len:203 (+) Transcript_44410:131-739(+)